MQALLCVSRIYESSHSEDSESAKTALGQKHANWEHRDGGPAKPSSAPCWAAPGAMEHGPLSLSNTDSLTSPLFVHQVGSSGEGDFQVLDHLARIF